MLRGVLLACALLATKAEAEEALVLCSGCYKQELMRDIVELSDDDGMMLAYQYIKDGKCAPTIATLADWDAGPVIRDTGVKAVYVSIYNWTNGNLPDQLPPKQLMYFDARAGTRE